jgi:hypothetical protein
MLSYTFSHLVSLQNKNKINFISGNMKYHECKVTLRVCTIPRYFRTFTESF